jgi:hypothetical protein
MFTSCDPLGAVVVPSAAVSFGVSVFTVPSGYTTVVVSDRVTVDPLAIVVVVVPFASVAVVGVVVVVVRVVDAGVEYALVFVVTVVLPLLSVDVVEDIAGVVFRLLVVVVVDELLLQPIATIISPAARTARTARLISIVFRLLVAHVDVCAPLCAVCKRIT